MDFVIALIIGMVIGFVLTEVFRNLRQGWTIRPPRGFLARAGLWVVAFIPIAVWAFNMWSLYLWPNNALFQSVTVVVALAWAVLFSRVAFTYGKQPSHT
jgi:protein-S-isoprenylcysteine O-methyltransferase Ste14